MTSCQDLSQAGLGKGMSKGSSTRSGLLWEVERLLGEMTEKPQVLLMENVPQVIGKTGIKDFAKWVERLEQFGYKNYWQCLNAKDYGIPQNRNRCFMISLLGDYDYTFPKPQKLTVRLKDFLDKTIGEKYYLSDKTVEMLIEQHNFNENTTVYANYKRIDKVDTEYAKTLCARDYKGFNTGFDTMNAVVEVKCEQVGMLSGGKWDKLHEQSRRVYSPIGLAPTIHTCGGGNLEPKIAYGIALNESEEWRKPPLENLSRTILANKANGGCGVIESIAYDEQNGYLRQDGTVGTLTTDGNSPKHNNRIVEIVAVNENTNENSLAANICIRKLTERECFKLMGVKNDDYKNVAKNQSSSSLYHLAGDSIVTSCLMAIFGELFGVDYKDKINKLVESLKDN